jgi:predicted nuclease of predicted toxin-antitoxin system
MRLLLDMNLPPSVADWLRSEGHEAIHVRELDLSDASDREIFSRAAADARIVVSFDLDFGEIAGLARDAAVGAVLLRLRLTSRPHLQQRLRAALSAAATALQAGAIVLVEDSRIRIRLNPADGAHG